MPKNAVQRLQKIDKDIKTVLSIYDPARRPNEKDGTTEKQKEREALQFSRISTSKCWESNTFLDELRQKSNQSPSLLLDSFKQIGAIVPQLDEVVHPRESLLAGKKPAHGKQNSAPSSSSNLSTICESDYKWQQSMESVNSSSGKPLKTTPRDSLNVFDWVGANCFQGEIDEYMSPSKTLLTANEILARNNRQTGTSSEGEDNAVQQSVGILNASFDAERVGECHERAKVKDVTVKASPRHKSPDHVSHLPIRIPESRSSRDDQKYRIFRQLCTVPKKTSFGLEKSEKHSRSRRSSRERRSATKDVLETQERGWSNAKVEDSHRRGRREKNGKGDRHERRSRSAYERERRTQSPANSQKARKSPGVDLRANELSKIIEKSNEKLEKMKMSKELALDIAKQLKSKYDEIQQSREGLVEKLQSVEESKLKLQIKMDGLKKNSKTKLYEQELKTKELLEENANLKIKIAELEKQHNEKLLEKQEQIDKLQKERLTEIRNELKHRETQANEVQTLNNEKAELAGKMEELRATMKDRQTAIEHRERKISLLEEELQKERENLKKKTERLEETNKELESIRKSSNDLEEQVKTLRRNIENFDNLHKNMVRQTAEYEHQIKVKQEENKSLQDEISRLKAELENGKDALLIKNKIIEDQQHTIKQVREKGEEVRNLEKRNKSLERILNIEREEKLELQEAIERLKWRKEELKNKVKNLENDLLRAPQEVVRDLQKTQVVLHELENQVQIKQKEWEVHLQALIREKEQACSVAEFATKKLMQTTSEFQKQSEAHKKLHRALAENLAEKERHLREATEKFGRSEKIGEFWN